MSTSAGNLGDTRTVGQAPATKASHTQTAPAFSVFSHAHHRPWGASAHSTTSTLTQTDATPAFTSRMLLAPSRTLARNPGAPGLTNAPSERAADSRESRYTDFEGNFAPIRTVLSHPNSVYLKGRHADGRTPGIVFDFSWDTRCRRGVSLIQNAPPG